MPIDDIADTGRLNSRPCRVISKGSFPPAPPDAEAMASRSSRRLASIENRFFVQAQCSRSPTARAALVAAGFSAPGPLIGRTVTTGIIGERRRYRIQAAADGRSVIFLFLHGGPSQFETFDPKMAAPAEIRSTTGEISTSIPGITFGSTFPKLAGLADRLSIVRSFTTGNANHDIKPVVSRHTGGANLGSLYARIAGATDPTTGMPRNALLFPRAVHPGTGPEQTQFGRFDATGAPRLGLCAVRAWCRRRSAARHAAQPANRSARRPANLARRIGPRALAVRFDRPDGPARQTSRAGVYERHEWNCPGL